MTSKSTPITQVVSFPDYSQDDDETIQEVLQSLAQTTTTPGKAPQPQPVPVPVSAATTLQYMDRLSSPIHLWDGDARNAIVVMALAAITFTLPVEKLIHTYVNVESIPYSKHIIKAVLTGAAFYIAAKTFL